MEITREIYWNVGHGPLTLVPMYLLAIGAMRAVLERHDRADPTRHPKSR